MILHKTSVSKTRCTYINTTGNKTRCDYTNTPGSRTRCSYINTIGNETICLYMNTWRVKPDATKQKKSEPDQMMLHKTTGGETICSDRNTTCSENRCSYRNQNGVRPDAITETQPRVKSYAKRCSCIRTRSNTRRSCKTTTGSDIKCSYRSEPRCYYINTTVRETRFFLHEHIESETRCYIYYISRSAS